MPSEILIIQNVLTSPVDKTLDIYPYTQGRIGKRTIHHAAGSLIDEGMVYRKERGRLPNILTHFAYKPDAALFNEALSATKVYGAESISVDGETYQPRVYPEIVTASDLFGVNQAKIDDMRTKLKPDLMKMESAAIAQVCDHPGTPHIVFRAESNRTQPNPGTFYRKYGQTAGGIAMQ